MTDNKVWLNNNNNNNNNDKDNNIQEKTNTGWVKKKYTHLMSHKTVTIALSLEI